MIEGELLTHLINGEIYVDKADPEVMFMDSLLSEIRNAPHPSVSLVSDVLEIRATNGTYRYQLDHHGWDRVSRKPGRVAHLIEPKETA